MAIATPQIIATIASSIIFKFFQRPRGMPGDHSIAIVMACGGLATLAAAFMISRIKDEVELPEESVEEGHPRRRSQRPGRRSEDGDLIRSQSFSGLGY
jgi:solute carrier family 45 protein 1/2/4